MAAPRTPLLDEHSSSAASSPPGGPDSSRSVLLVDDESGVRDFATDVLSRAGYHLYTAATAGEAVRLLMQHGERIGVIVLDMSLPDMSCREACELLEAVAPNTPLVFCTGYVHDIELVLERRLRVIQKPFPEETFVRVIRETMRGGDAAVEE